MPSTTNQPYFSKNVKTLMATIDKNGGVSFFGTGSIGGGPPSLLAAGINKQEQYSLRRKPKAKTQIKNSKTKHVRGTSSVVFNRLYVSGHSSGQV